MRQAVLLGALFAAPIIPADTHVRFARVTLAEGPVEVEIPQRIPAVRNLPVGQGHWIESGTGGRVELELDEGSMVRLGANSLAELSDMTRLSTGQRITVISLERGTLYATAEPPALDAIVLTAPGLEISFLRGARVRLEAGENTSIVAVIEGRVRFSSRVAELTLEEGHTVRVDPASDERFQLMREFAAAAMDPWNEQRDREAVARDAGAGELEAHGKWVEIAGQGKLWQPRVSDGWAPFRQGRWRWYDPLGYTWVSAEPWGWLPYHWGRWMHLAPHGWLWRPDAGRDLFQPGAVYWLQAGKLAGWGPLAPAEDWPSTVAPALYAPAHTTWTVYQPGIRFLDPAGVPEAKTGAQFVAALPTPPPDVAAISRPRRKTRVGATRVAPVSADQSYDPRRTQQSEAADLAREGIRIVGAAPPPAAAPAPPVSGNYYYYNNTTKIANVPPPPAPAPDPTYYPVYIPLPVVVVEDDRPMHHEADRPRHRPQQRPPTPRASPSPTPPASPKSESPAPPSKQAPATPPAATEGPEHRTRLRSPEGSDVPARRR